MTKRNVMIEILTQRYAVAESLFDAAEGADEEGMELAEPAPAGEPSDEPSEMLVEGRLVTTPSRVELIYEEGELSGMEGSVTSIGFDRTSSGLISMMRTGLVSTAMVFEEGKRHLCLYQTPFSDFEICVRALRVENRLLQEGRIELDYLIEVHGAQAERCKMRIQTRRDEDPQRFTDYT